MTAKDFKLLGKLIYAQSPAASRQLLSDAKHLHLEIKDYSQIQSYFNRFRIYKNLHEGIPSIRYNRALRVFFSAMIHIYLPGLLIAKKCWYLPSGFINELHHVSGKNKGNISRDINLVLFREKVYEEYRQEVQDLLNHLKEHES